MTTYAKLDEGDVIKVGGEKYTVAEVKLRGVDVKLTVERKGSSRTVKVPASGKVKRVGRAELHDATGAQQRWATPAEAQLSDSPWETQADRIEQRLEKLLGATLVGQSVDGGETYAVPHVDVTTVAAHLLVFHDVDPSQYADEQAMLEAHATAPDKIPHTHTDIRPETR